MEQRIALAFSHRNPPASLTEVVVGSTLRDAALHFVGRDWTGITSEEWVDYSDAYYGFAPHAFAYFLPSILTLSLKHPTGSLLVSEALVMCLDTSADPDIWPEWFSDRFRLLTLTELGVMKDWAAFYLARAEKGVGSEFARVLDTLTMLELCLQS